MDRIPAELEAEMTPAVKAFVLSLLREIDQLKQQVEKLTPRNSSIPPSTEHPHAKPDRKKKKGSGKKRGGQKGHPRNLRELVPPEKCNSLTNCLPTECRCCGGELRLDDTQPRRHQVWEWPPIQPIVDEYRIFRGRCDRCGVATSGSLPDGVPTGQCGPRLAAFVGLLMGHFRQSKRKTASFLETLLNIPCSPAWTVKIQNLVSKAIAVPYEDLRSQLTEQSQLYVDESPTKEAGKKSWLWVAVAPLFVVFGLFGNRKRESLVKLVGNYQEIILNCDRAKMYLDGKQLQWCWAHLTRDIQKLIDSRNNMVKRLGHDLMRQQKLLFQHWRRYCDGEIKWSTFQRLARPIRNEFNALLLRGRFSDIGFANELWPRREHLWTFLRVEGIEPTNNAAERALRPAVILRKLTFGTQSATGSRFLERILTITETCRIQQRNAFEYLTEAMQAKMANQTAGTLRPNDKSKLQAA